MSSDKSHPRTNVLRSLLMDPVLWLWDLVVGFILGWLGILLLGHRPRGCHTVNRDTPDGAYHGCGLACRYGDPEKFVSLCRQCTVRTDSQGTDHVLCSLGNVPVFRLRLAIFAPLFALSLVGILAGAAYGISNSGVASRLRELGDTDESMSVIPSELSKEDRAQEPEAAETETTESEGAEEPATTVETPTPPEVEASPVPSAMERFRMVVEGPKEEDGRGVDLQIVPKSSDLIMRQLRKAHVPSVKKPPRNEEDGN